MHIKVTDYAPYADTWRQGEIIFNLVKDVLMTGEKITLDFLGVPSLTPSFSNACFAPMAALIGYEQLKKQVDISFIRKNEAAYIKKICRQEDAARKMK